MSSTKFHKKGGINVSIKDEAELFMAMRNYSCEDREKWDEGIDITALDTASNEKVLLRIVESKSKSGYVGIDTVRKMLEAMEKEDYDKGVLFGKRFTDAAKHELMQNDIQRISEGYMPTFKPERLYLRINQYVNDLCKEKCGKIPEKESDCKGDCRIRIISDNASFHFEQGWINLMKKDLKQLLALNGSKKSD
ncbi:restriction endonuclease [Candidatus Bathyarchaeota archaeon]|nr:restriction endonuclease [Candidatus Bathyarchaeota archaeon]